MFYCTFSDIFASQKGKMEGVDNKNPPNSKLFNSTNKQNTNDVALLAQ